MSLAEQYRPQTIDDISGQPRATSLIKTMLANDSLTSMVFYGPPGCGKTTLARIIADTTSMPSIWLNATTAGIKELREAVSNHDETVLVYLDEIQYWNKKQHQSLLSFIEDGTIVLIAATTENPWHGLYRALLSRMTIVEFTPLDKQSIAHRLTHIQTDMGLSIVDADALQLIGGIAAGDMRRAINMYEALLAAYPNNTTITTNDVRAFAPSINMSVFDTLGDTHYALVSALQKSIRGSDPDAAVFYLARFLEAGDMVSPCRRLPAICCEDIGLADPNAIMHTMACIQAAEALGLPEAYKPLTQAVIYLALAPKSASNEAAWMPAREDIRNGYGTVIPPHIASEHAPAYIWPQDKPNHWVNQQYLPDDLRDKHYWTPQDNAFEQERYSWWYCVRNNPKKLPSMQPKL